METIKNSHKKTKILTILLCIVAICAIAYSIYLSRQIVSVSSERDELNSSLSKTKSDLKNIKTEMKKKSTIQDVSLDTTKKKEASAAAPQSSIDGNFTALRPNGGFLSNQTSVTFEWTPHSMATKYIVEIKRPGQANYPATSSSDQVSSTSQDSNGVIKLSKNLQPGDYVWRVSAQSTKDGQEVTLQSTEDRNYQVR